jgi:bifunctional DNA-binding transcriptional regulator/antitoxin component of YhaV-PrlF toxin-antitoxin module
MQMRTQGQMTIPQEIRRQLRLLPHAEVKFELVNDRAHVRKARSTASRSARAGKANNAAHIQLGSPPSQADILP